MNARELPELFKIKIPELYTQAMNDMYDFLFNDSTPCGWVGRDGHYIVDENLERVAQNQDGYLYCWKDKDEWRWWISADPNAYKLTAIYKADSLEIPVVDIYSQKVVFEDHQPAVDELINKINSMFDQDTSKDYKRTLVWPVVDGRFKIRYVNRSLSCNQYFIFAFGEDEIVVNVHYKKLLEELKSVMMQMSLAANSRVKQAKDNMDRVMGYHLE